MLIPAFPSPKDQMCKLGRHHWSVARLFDLSKSLPVFCAEIDCLSVYYLYDGLTMRDMVMHMRTVNSADLDFPIILDEDGVLMDGRHRLMKALLNGDKTIKAVRFQENPSPCRVDD